MYTRSEKKIVIGHEARPYDDATTRSCGGTAAEISIDLPPSASRALALKTSSVPLVCRAYRRGQPQSCGLWKGGICAMGHSLRWMLPAAPSVVEAVAHGGTIEVATRER